MSVLVYDTETTGFPVNGIPADDPAQPHTVQLAAKLFDTEGNVRGAINFILNCDVRIPDKVAEIHGITTEIATQYGVSPHLAIDSFATLVHMADVLVAHNNAFDLKLLDTLAARTGTVNEHRNARLKHYDTMEMGKTLTKLPPTPAMVKSGRVGFKPPKLIELHQFLFGEGFSGAHDAMIDVDACARCYFELIKRGN